MVKNTIELDKETNRIINIVKAERDLKDKSQAVNMIVKEFGMVLLEPELRPEYVKKLKRIERERTVSKEEFEKRLKVKI